jgi:hypothetical protein
MAVAIAWLAACGPRTVAGSYPRAVCSGCTGPVMTTSQLTIDTSWEGTCEKGALMPSLLDDKDRYLTCNTVDHVVEIKCPKARCTVAGNVVTAVEPGQLVIRAELRSRRWVQWGDEYRPEYGRAKTVELGPYEVRNPARVDARCQFGARGSEVTLTLVAGEPLRGGRPRVTDARGRECTPVSDETNAITRRYTCDLDRTGEQAFEVRLSPQLALPFTANCIAPESP